MKIRTRLLLTSLILFAAGSYWLVDWILKDFRYHYFMTMEESMNDSATVLASIVSRQIQDGEIQLSDSVREGIRDSGSRIFSAEIYAFTKTNSNLRVLITDRKGIVVFDSFGKDEGVDYSTWRDIRLTLAGQYGARATHTIPGKMHSLTFYVASPLLVDGEIQGALSVGKPVSSIQPFMDQAKNRLIATGILAVSFVLLLQILVSYWVTKPIRTLTAYARAVRDGKKTPRPDLGRGDLGDLAAAFEEMRDALENRKYVETYVQTLTHEMKSPLAAIQGASELLQEEMPETQRMRFLNNIQTETDRMHDLVDRMLDLAGIENRKELRNPVSIDLAQLIQETTDSLLPASCKKNLNVEQMIEQPVPVVGEYFLLRQAVSNLIQNAIDFSPDGGTIQIYARQENERVIIQIIDEGPGIPDYARERIFDRFYSLARPDTGAKSSGLGLNFVREAAALHGGTIELTSRTPRGTEAALALPLSN
jgi:two-component system sensor histidine kinase CreC